MKIQKYCSVLVIWMLLIGVVSAQNRQEKIADFEIAEQSYHQGITHYEKILERADEATALRINYKLAQVYYTIRDYESSINHYNVLLDEDKLDMLTVDDQCNILTMLNRMEKTADAEKWATKFVESNTLKDDQRLRNLQRSIMGIEVPISDDTLKYVVKNTPMSSTYSDFWTGELNDSLLLFVRSDAGQGDTAKILFRGSRFYTFSFQSQAISLYKDFPLVFQAGPAAIYKGGKAMIYTDNNMESGKKVYKVSHVTQRNLQLIYATYNAKKGEWKIVKSIFKSDDPSISYCHPCLANNDQTLFFASNMAKGHGGMDIYRSQWNKAAKKWGNPINLGPIINTDGDEIYPMVRDSMLYFSSNGHIGLGGYDIYGAKISAKGEVISKQVLYLPSPINTRFNDYSLFLNKNKTSGYFTSDRNGGNGVDDIYAYQAKPKPKPKPIVIPKVKNVDTTDIIQAITKVEELTNVYFDFDKSKLKDLDVMQHALELMQKKEYDNVSFLLLGSADSRGPSEYNILLSQHRAEAVKKWLVEQGFDGDRLITQARGAIPLSDAELRKSVGLPALGVLSDKEMIRKAYQEARRVIIKTIIKGDGR